MKGSPASFEVDVTYGLSDEDDDKENEVAASTLSHDMKLEHHEAGDDTSPQLPTVSSFLNTIQ